MVAIWLGSEEQGEARGPQHIAVGFTIAMWPQGSWFWARAEARRKARFTDEGRQAIHDMVSKYDALVQGQL